MRRRPSAQLNLSSYFKCYSSSRKETEWEYNILSRERERVADKSHSEGPVVVVHQR